MKLGDMLAGTKPDEPDPMDEPSGVRLTVEPSRRLLEMIDRFVEESSKRGKTLVREEALVAMAAGGGATFTLIDGIFDFFEDANKKAAKIIDENTEVMKRLTRPTTAELRMAHPGEYLALDGEQNLLAHSRSREEVLILAAEKGHARPVILPPVSG